jgi:hypothetical protein
MSFWASYLSFLGFLVGGGVAGTVAQEAGHLLCARIGSIRIRRMVMGWGPVLLRGRVGDVRVEARLVLLGGWVICAETASAPKRWAVALYFLGGVLGNIAVIGVAIWLHVVGAAPTVLGIPLILTPVGILVATQVFFIIVGLMSPLAYAALPKNKRYREGTTRPPIGSGSWASVRIAAHLARLNQRTSEVSHRKVWMTLRQELAGGDLTPEDEMRALDALISDRPAARRSIVIDLLLRPELDTWSQRALQLGPKVKTLVATRGTALVELGRYHEGKALLETVAFIDGAPLLDSVLSRMFLARAEHALGNAAAARSLIAQARAIARTGVRWPALAAWIALMERELREVRFRRWRAKWAYGRRSLKAQSKLSLPRVRLLEMDRAARSSSSRRQQARRARRGSSAGARAASVRLAGPTYCEGQLSTRRRKTAADNRDP